MSKLTEKQKRFADEYIKSGNATESARLAGYSPKTAKEMGSQNLTKLNIRTYIDKVLKEMDSKRIMDAKEALELLSGIARGEIEETIFMSSPLGVVEVTKKADINQRKDAAKEILKRFPNNVEDAKRLGKAQADKAEAEARIIENKASKLTNDEMVDELLNALISPELSESEQNIEDIGVDIIDD